ncbi:hypothetical protein T492DRAFT_981538, partial [Pavlovales sp. CCMP2436]
LYTACMPALLHCTLTGPNPYDTGKPVAAVVLSMLMRTYSPVMSQSQCKQHRLMRLFQSWLSPIFGLESLSF